MKINKQQVVDELGLIHFGSKGWMSSEDTRCPVCDRSDKFGILFTESGGTTHCFYNCGDNMSLYSYLKHIGRLDLCQYEKQTSIESKLISVYKDEIEETEIPEATLPKGYERIFFDKYLSDRNFKSYQYDEFEVGVTHHFLEKRLWNYLIFVLRQKGRVVGWLARSKYSKKWHKENLENYKSGLCELTLRYRNSTGTDFERILGGFDQITENTQSVILVEGLFDYTNISRLLETNKSEGLKVCFTFGDKVSGHQIQLLRNINIRNVTLMYDSNTVDQSKRYGMELFKYFNTNVCYISDPEIDPGNMTLNYLQETLNNQKNIFYFYTSKIKL